MTTPPEQSNRAEVSDERFYVEVERTDYTYIEIVARSRDEAQGLVDEMTAEEIIENADDWDWDGHPPCPTGTTLTEDELIAQGEPDVPDS